MINKTHFVENQVKIDFDHTSIPVSQIIEAVVDTNNYLISLDELFRKIGFNLFITLGQRNLSGVIGEIFSRFLAAKQNNLVNNPHADGRPDILNLDTEEIFRYYESCFNNVGEKRMPIKNMLAPFKYGGLEVKCTIGDPITKYKKMLESKLGKSDFEIGIPRIEYLSNLNWWAHHTKSSNLLGLYYDYYEEYDYLPQILAGFYGNLNADDWRKVSIGKAENKKTSNTSLNILGKAKMKKNCLFYINDEIYITQLRSIDITI